MQLITESRVVRNKEFSESDSGLIEIHPKLLSIPTMPKYKGFYWMMLHEAIKKEELCIIDKIKPSSKTPGGT